MALNLTICWMGSEPRTYISMQSPYEYQAGETDNTGKEMFPQTASGKGQSDGGNSRGAPRQMDNTGRSRRWVILLTEKLYRITFSKFGKVE